MPSLTVVFRAFLECLQYRRVGWILMMKIRVRVGMKASKMVQQSARLEEGDGMQGGCAKGRKMNDERRLGLMRDCMMRDAATIVGRLSAFVTRAPPPMMVVVAAAWRTVPWHFWPSLARPRGDAAAVVAARMMVPRHHQPVVPRSPAR